MDRYEWTDAFGTCAIATEDGKLKSYAKRVDGTWARQITEFGGNTFAPEILRLAQEVEDLRGSLKTQEQLYFKASAEERANVEAEIRCLAEENAALRAERDSRPTNGEALAGRRAGARYERARIRRELLAYFDPDQRLKSDDTIATSAEDFYDILNRILPEES